MSISVKVNLENMRRQVEFIKNIPASGLLQEAANMLAAEAYITMYNTYLGTSRRKYRNRKNKYTIENTVFNGVPKAELTSNGVKISLIADYDKIRKQVPHLDWQESGTNAMVDKQPYLIQRNGLMAIKKNSVGAYKVFAGARKNYFQHVGSVAYLQVPHPGLSARHFIKSGNYFIKTQGASFIRNYILSRMK